jgi:hypothetical protein
VQIAVGLGFWRGIGENGVGLLYDSRFFIKAANKIV